MPLPHSLQSAGCLGFGRHFRYDPPCTQRVGGEIVSTFAPGASAAVPHISNAGVAGRRLERSIEKLEGLTGDGGKRRLAAPKQPETSKTRFQTYWEHTAECLFAVRVAEDGTFVFEGLNPAHERVSGLTNAMIAGKAPHECLPAEIADAI